MAGKSRYHRRSDGLYETTRTDRRTGHRHHFYGKTIAEVEQSILQWTGEQARGRSFETVASAWWEQHEPKLAHSTVNGYRVAFERAVAGFSSTPIKKITPREVNAFIESFARGGRAKKTVANQLLILNLIFRYSVIEGDIEYNPCQNVRVPTRLPQGKRPAACKSDEKIIKKSCDVWFLPYFILYTGLRSAEVRALQWKDIDLDTNLITVSKAIVTSGRGAWHFKTTKTLAGMRQVPILAPLREKLNNIGNPEDFLFFAHEPTTPISESQFTKLWIKFRQATGASCTAHQLRHSFATMLYECGIGAKTAQHLLGHAQISTTLDIYTEFRNENIKIAASEINEKLNA